ncbi:hypothetical protein F5148DRAFT_1150094 [Russula earlei]|uniref:Uncharacterized protein n=1 Tax=Russula earlei TaxID=71964 RepID=A0ACC0U629_9AGAM|nr:hypothetical protein F5148DRAFT_1150094 [Russula earlei]
MALWGTCAFVLPATSVLHRDEPAIVEGSPRPGARRGVIISDANLDEHGDPSPSRCEKGEDQNREFGSGGCLPTALRSPPSIPSDMRPSVYASRRTPVAPFRLASGTGGAHGGPCTRTNLQSYWRFVVTPASRVDARLSGSEFIAPCHRRATERRLENLAHDRPNSSHSQARGMIVSPNQKPTGSAAPAPDAPVEFEGVRRRMTHVRWRTRNDNDNDMEEKKEGKPTNHNHRKVQGALAHIRNFDVHRHRLNARPSFGRPNTGRVSRLVLSALSCQTPLPCRVGPAGPPFIGFGRESLAGRPVIAWRFIVSRRERHAWHAVTPASFLSISLRMGGEKVGRGGSAARFFPLALLLLLERREFMSASLVISPSASSLPRFCTNSTHTLDWALVICPVSSQVQVPYHKW